MANELQELRPNAPARDIGTITDEIHAIKYQARVVALYVAVELGRRLVEAKELLPHGAWGDWLRDEADIKPSTANNYMRLFEEYGASQLTLFGASVKSQTIENLPMSKALLLLAVPAEEREEFAEKVNAEDLSVRELKAVIEERDVQKQRADSFAKQVEAAEAARAEAEAKAEEARKAAEAAKKLAGEAERLQAKLLEEQTAKEKEHVTAAALREELKKAREEPEISASRLEAIRKEAEKDAKQAAEEAAKKELEAAKAKADKATQEAIKAKNAASEAERRAAAAEKQLKTASPEIAAFKAIFESVQSSVAKLQAMITTLRATDPDTAGRLAAALHAFGTKL